MRCPAHGLIEVTHDPRFEVPRCPRILIEDYCGLTLELAGYFTPTLTDLR